MAEKPNPEPFRSYADQCKVDTGAAADSLVGETYGGSGGPRVRSRPKRRLALLARAVEGAIEHEVLPRLIRAHRSPVRSEAGAAPAGAIAQLPSDAEIARFTDLALLADDDPSFAFVAELRHRGMSLESVYLGLMAPAARLLGEYWCEDRRSFAEVTLGLCRLHQMLRGYSREFQSDARPRVAGLQALLLPVPGEQHSFGLLMLAEFFRRDGWGVSSGPFGNRSELVGAVASDWFAIVGFSISAPGQMKDLMLCIQSVRRASRNRSVAIMVGGPIFVEHPDWASRVGADGMACAAPEAVRRARELVQVHSQGI